MPRYQPSKSSRKNRTDSPTRIVSARSKVRSLRPRRNKATSATPKLTRMARKKRVAATTVRDLPASAHFNVIGRSGRASTCLAIVGLLALAAVFATLGSWQLRRAETSSATLAQFSSGAAKEALFELPSELDGASRFRRVELEGEYVAAPQFLLDNMVHDGVAGYHVLTALRLRGGRDTVLVNRGWVRSGDRRVLPDVDVEPGTRRVVGRLEQLPRPGLRLGDEAAGAEPAGAAVVLQYPTAGELARRLGEPVRDYQVLLDAGEPQGFVRAWRAPGTGPERHLSYAGQWLALSAGAFAAAIVMAVKLRRRAREN